MTHFARTAQEDHPYLLEWLSNARDNAGGFLSSLAQAALVADPDNYVFIRPVIVAMRAKYPAYEPSEAVKQELADAVAHCALHASAVSMFQDNVPPAVVANELKIPKSTAYRWYQEWKSRKAQRIAGIRNGKRTEENMFEKEVKEITDAAAALQTKLAAVETKLDQVSARLEQLSAKLDEVLLDPPESAR